ncbi:LamB/YcsF family protein [Salinithrix halophila]|uniref:5-oxoprolinase subunit A n=1 Tax=Salinithrix halophila TaxID=1485204 RepID=A0ABV8J8R9_9BACL
MKLRIDLNSDLGESFGSYTMGRDEEILEYVSSANIACGYHAGDHNVMQKTVRAAVNKGVGLGAHPGLPDLLGFGRRYIAMEPEDVFNLTLYQVGALAAFATAEGAKLQHVKPHGALFHMASKEEAIAEAIAGAVAAVDKGLILFGLAGSLLVKAGRKEGLPVAEEVFADRTYLPDGTLTPRTLPDAFIHDPGEAAARVVRMLNEGKVRAVDGTDIELRADTVCVHGDDPKAVAFVRHLCGAFEAEGIDVKRVGES